MRLLLCSDTGEFSLTKDLVGDDMIPPYAILSHTWGADTEEVTFEDVTNGTGEDKPGYEKIRFCGEQARQDDLKYFWVDTCCINKANYTELSHAINSMFRWYRNATRCYIYLSDVSSPAFDTNEELSRQSWESAFRKSRWFKRGWTLQELLAPISVEFFSREHKRLGSKRSLTQKIREITGIADSALQEAPLCQFSVDERLSWIEHRRTKLEEDKAYSLLGIFDVSMPLIYGEGEEKAFKRLREEIDKPLMGLLQRQVLVQMEKADQECIQHLRLTDPRDDKKRIEESKGGLLEDSYRWILDNSDFRQWRNDQQRHLLWIKGDPGKGKTMLLCGIVNEMKKSMAETDLLSFFFCQATDSRISNATAVLRGLMYLLVDERPSLIQHIRKKHDHAGKALFEDVNSWVALSEIFTNVLQDPSLNSTYLIIDALDECVVDLPKLLNFIVQKSSVSPRVKWIVSSRNWPDIEKDLDTVIQKVRLCLELNEKSVSAAVAIYIQFKVNWLARRNKYTDATREDVQRYLSLNASGTFLWVALVCQELANISGYNAQKKLRALPPGLDALYRRMVDQICNSEDSELCKRILAIVSTVYRPVTWDELASFVEMPDGVPGNHEAEMEIIGLCGSFLTLREHIISFVHQSAKDFLLEKASKEICPSGTEDIHHTIFLQSLQVMSRALQRDVYRLGALGFPIDQVNLPDPDPLAAARYSCVYWIDHLHDCNPRRDANTDLQDGASINRFLCQHYLHWLEGLSLCRSMSEGLLSMTKLEALIEGRAGAFGLMALVRDARRFIMYHKRAIENSPLQVYASALVFSPARSLIRCLFKDQEPKWITIRPAIGDNWSACLQTLEGHSHSVNSVAFSHDSTLLVSASNDKTIKIWDISSSKCLQTLEGHYSRVNSVTFSHDSTLLVSASNDKTIKIWDISSGKCLQTLEGHSSRVNSVAFSHNSTLLVSASNDKTVKIWDTSSDKCLQTLEGHSSWISLVAFSHDSTLLASASEDETVKTWDVSSGKCLQTLRGHSSMVNSVAFSHNSTLLASASDDKTVIIWDTSSGKCLQTLEDCSRWVNSVTFSYDSTLLASASGDKTVKIWDTSSSKCLQTLEGHSSMVNSVAFSHNSTLLVSASNDKTVKIWDTNNGKDLQIPEGHSRWVSLVAFSHDSTLLASASNDKTIKIWDISSGKCLQTLEGHSGRVNSVTFSHDSTLLASISKDKTVKIWNINNGKCLQTLKGYSGRVKSVAFSHDSTLLASASNNKMIKIWDTSNSKCMQTLEGHSSRVNSVAFSHDSILLVSASNDKTIKIWDISSGKCLQTLEGHSDRVNSVTFSHGSTLLVSASNDKTVKIWNINSGECLQTLEIGKTLFNISMDITGSYLQTDIGTIAINTSLALNITPSVTDPQNPRYQGWALSSDGAWITYNSENWVWLPSEYRPSCSAVLGKTIGIGVGSGKVWICSFKIDNA